MTAGETWTREVLTELKASRFTPAAWTRFLARSHARAGERRAERPSEHRTVAALGVAGLLLWILAAVAGRPQLALAGAGWWLLQALMLDWHLGLLQRSDGSRLDGVGPANVITILRGGLPPAVLALAGTSAGAVLLAAAGAADVVDGRLARRRNEASNLGIWLDGAVDTTILGAATVGAAQRGLLPAWATALVGARLVVPWAVVSVAYFAAAERPTRSGFARGRLPRLAAGTVLFAGLLLAFFELPGGAPLAAAGAVAGLATFAQAIRRTRWRRRDVQRW